MRIRTSRDFTSFGVYVIGLLLLCGDISTHPGPCGSTSVVSATYKCIVLNARSLKSFHRITGPHGQMETVCNLHRFQDFVYSEDSDIVCVNETWLNDSLDSLEILHNGYIIFRKDRHLRRAGVPAGF